MRGWYSCYTDKHFRILYCNYSYDNLRTISLHCQLHIFLSIPCCPQCPSAQIMYSGNSVTLLHSQMGKRYPLHIFFNPIRHLIITSYCLCYGVLLNCQLIIITSYGICYGVLLYYLQLILTSYGIWY